MSRLGSVKPAVRPALKARLLLGGPSGSGKTRSALMVAERLAPDGRVLVIDTEEQSALTYADLHTFEHLAWLPPFDPRELARNLSEIEHDVVIVDSMSHFWAKAGGTLSIADGKFTNWKDARPIQEDLHLSVLRCPAHVILCVRAKQKHTQQDDPSRPGKQQVVKLGLGLIQDDQLEYDVNLALDVDMAHGLTVAKSRIITVPVGREFPAGHAVDFADVYADWLKGGEPPATSAQVKQLKARMDALAEDQRKVCKQQFAASFGLPDHLRASQWTDADDLVKAFENVEVEQ